MFSFCFKIYCIFFVGCSALLNTQTKNQQIQQQQRERKPLLLRLHSGHNHWRWEHRKKKRGPSRPVALSKCNCMPLPRGKWETPKERWIDASIDGNASRKPRGPVGRTPKTQMCAIPLACRQLHLLCCVSCCCLFSLLRAPANSSATYFAVSLFS